VLRHPGQKQCCDILGKKGSKTSLKERNLAELEVKLEAAGSS